ncbi:integrase [Methylobacterium mesophilicum]
MAVTLKQQSVDAHVAKAKAGVEPYDVIDKGCPGLILRIKPRGASWGLKFERADRTMRLKIGVPGILDLEAARTIAGAARKALASPHVELGEEWLRDQYVGLGLAHARPVRDESLIAAFMAEVPHLMCWRWEEARESYLTEVKRTLRFDTWKDYRTMLHVRELDGLAGKQVRSITRQDLAGIVAEIHETGRERHAEHLASVLRPMWSYLAEDRCQKKGSGITEPFPLLKAPKRSAEVKLRDNGKTPGGYTASPEEIGTAVAVARSGALDRSLSVAMETMVATGQRRRPVAGALLVDFVPWVEQPGWGVWSMGPAHRKTAAKRMDKHRHVIPLPPPLWARIQEQMARAAAVGSEYLFPQVRARRAGEKADGHLSDSSLNHRLIDIGLKASPHDMRRGLATTCQKRLRIPRDTVKMILDHNEGIRSDDVLESHYTEDDRLDLKGPTMERWWEWLEAQVAATALPDLTTLKAEISRRRREREAAGKAKTAAAAAAKEAEEKAKASAEREAVAA